MSLAGLVLAAGAGTRMGQPKALVHDPEGDSWLVRGIETLREGGCHHVTVVLGARAEEARALVPPGVGVVVAGDWADGIAASLRAGLVSLTETDVGLEAAEAAVVTLVDLPDVTAEVVLRVVAAGAGATTLSRATYAGRPGHPVVLGRRHWTGVIGSVAGDRGARDYLATHDVAAIECGDLASGRDQDTPV